MNESLTSMNRMRQGAARMESERLKDRFPGYTVNGQVPVKKSKCSACIAITVSKHNLKYSWVIILCFYILFYVLVI